MVSGLDEVKYITDDRTVGTGAISAHRRPGRLRIDSWLIDVDDAGYTCMTEGPGECRTTLLCMVMGHPALVLTIMESAIPAVD
jgi:hypothetical protein